jgi:hypothetical protein
MPRTAVPPNRADLTGRAATSGEVVDSWNGVDGTSFRLVHTQSSGNRTGSVRVDATGFDGRTWRPVWAFRYDGPQLSGPRELTPDTYSADAVEVEAAPRWAHWWMSR